MARRFREATKLPLEQPTHLEESSRRSRADETAVNQPICSSVVPSPNLFCRVCTQVKHANWMGSAQAPLVLPSTGNLRKSATVRLNEIDCAMVGWLKNECVSGVRLAETGPSWHGARRCCATTKLFGSAWPVNTTQLSPNRKVRGHSNLHGSLSEVKFKAAGDWRDLEISWESRYPSDDA